MLISSLGILYVLSSSHWVWMDLLGKSMMAFFWCMSFANKLVLVYDSRERISSMLKKIKNVRESLELKGFRIIEIKTNNILNATLAR